MSSTIPDANPDRGQIPPPVEAADSRPGLGENGGGDLQRIAALDADRMRDSLAILAGIAPVMLDTILTATEPCADDFLSDDDALEPYCTECGAAAGIFIGLGDEWLHYTGDPLSADVRPYAADHEPVIGWRPAVGPVAVVAL